MAIKELLTFREYETHVINGNYKKRKVKRKLYKDRGDRLAFLRGIVDLLPKDKINIIDRTNKKEIPDIEFDKDEVKSILQPESGFDLRRDQIRAVKAILKLRWGTLQMATGAGKTAILASLLRYFNKKLDYFPKTVLIEPNLHLVKSTKDRFQKYKIPATMYTNHRNINESPVIITHPKSMNNDLVDNPEMLDCVKVAMFDECVSGDTEIMLGDGSYVTMKEVYQNDNLTEVMSYDTISNSFEPKKILDKKRYSSDSEYFHKVIYEEPIEGKDRSLFVTGNHKIWTENRGYVEVDDLNIGEDSLKIVSKLGLKDYKTKELDKEFYSCYTRIVKDVKKFTREIESYKYDLEVEDNHNYFADGILISNSHHSQADTWSKLMYNFRNVEFVVGTSASVVENPNNLSLTDLSFKEAMSLGCTGQLVLNVPASYYIKKGVLAEPVVFRIRNTADEDVNDEKDWSGELYPKKINSRKRNSKIVEIVTFLSKYDRKSLILVDRKDHARNILQMMADRGKDDIVRLSFGSNVNEKYDRDSGEIVETDDEVIKMFKAGDIKVMIATQHIDEGFDCPNLDAGVLAGGGKSQRRIIQRLGRMMRKSKKGNYAYIVDFTDHRGGVLDKHSKSRRKIYKDEIGITEEKLFDRYSVEEMKDKFKGLEGLSKTT